MKKEIPIWGKLCKVQMIMLDKSLEDISKETGFTRNYISTIINGRMIVPDETVQKICKALNVDADKEIVLA